MTTDNREPQAAPEAAAAPQMPQLPKDYPWMRVPTERGMRPTPGPDGLTLDLIDVGSYGDVPDVWPYRNDLPRGASPPPYATIPASYTIFDKVEVWSDNCRTLYEDAIRDRWSSSTDVPWETLKPNAEHIERAICQIATEMSEQAYVTLQVLSSWLEEISYGFHEVKNFLATQVFDNARHVEAFRKRALANGGGLGIESPGVFHKVPTTAMRFTEFVLSTNVVKTTFLLVVLDSLKKAATTDADRVLLTNVMRDLKRHLDYGVGHMQFYLQRQPGEMEIIHHWLNRAEMLLIVDHVRDTPFTESLILLLGNDVPDGRAQLEALRRRFVEAYLNVLADCRIFDRIEKLAPQLKNYVPEGAATPTTVSMRPPVANPLA